MHSEMPGHIDTLHQYTYIYKAHGGSCLNTALRCPSDIHYSSSLTTARRVCVHLWQYKAFKKRTCRKLSHGHREHPQNNVASDGLRPRKSPLSGQ